MKKIYCASVLAAALLLVIAGGVAADESDVSLGDTRKEEYRAALDQFRASRKVFQRERREEMMERERNRRGIRATSTVLTDDNQAILLKRQLDHHKEVVRHGIGLLRVKLYRLETHLADLPHEQEESEIAQAEQEITNFRTFLEARLLELQNAQTRDEVKQIAKNILDEWRQVRLSVRTHVASHFGERLDESTSRVGDDITRAETFLDTLASASGIRQSRDRLASARVAVEDAQNAIDQAEALLRGNGALSNPELSNVFAFLRNAHRNLASAIQLFHLGAFETVGRQSPPLLPSPVAPSPTSIE
ncbi:MAG: hypothetical protein HY460_00150 [Parcubacteria group bacterium]|nr:hypothetical protein [Parcubacteria group bacterium]